MGMVNGLALAGFVPVSIFPALELSCSSPSTRSSTTSTSSRICPTAPTSPKVIIRTGIGSERPLHPQYQHVGDFTEAFRILLQAHRESSASTSRTISFPAYEKAFPARGRQKHADRRAWRLLQRKIICPVCKRCARYVQWHFFGSLTYKGAESIRFISAARWRETPSIIPANPQSNQPPSHPWP